MRQLGYLGKVPHRGDFVRYNVPAQLHRAWDDWLGEVLLQAAQELEGWPEGYDAAPPWQFALSPDLAGDDARAGVLISSRDGVGRRYPFALFAALPDTTPPLEALAVDPALEALERIARSAIDDAAVYEGLKATLGKLQETLSERHREPDTVPFRPGSSTRAAEPAVFGEDAELLADRAGTTRLLDAVLRQGTGPYSAWRRRDSETLDGRLLISGGLPRGAAALALFGAEWSASAGGRLDGNARTDTRRPARPAGPDPAFVATIPASATVPDIPPLATAPTAPIGPRAVTPEAEAVAVAVAVAMNTVHGTAPGVRLPVDALAKRGEPLEVETLDIDDEEGGAPWDDP